MAFQSVGSLHIPWGNVTGKPSTFPPSSHTHSYLPLSGGTLTGGLNPQGGIAYWGNDYYIGYPYGGQLSSNNSSLTGYLKIALPVSWNSCMMKFKVSIYNYSGSTSCDYFVGGYNYNGGSNGRLWVQTSAYSIGDDVGSLCNLPVRFYHDGSKCCVGIGETTTKWAYPQVVISDLTIGFNGGTYASFRSGWNLSITSTAFANVSATVTSPYVGSSKYAPISHTHTFTQISDRSTYIYDATLSRTANTVLAAPNGSNGPGTFRKLVAADIPSLDAGKITSGTLPVARGGTGSTTAAAARTALGITPANIGAATSNHTHTDYLTTSGTAAAATKLATARTIALSGDVTGSTSFNGTADVTISATVANDSHTHSDSTITSVGAGKITGTLAIAHGGTGGTTAATARSNLAVMGAVYANGYYGMTKPDGDTGDWIRTTTNGIIPYQSGGSGSLGSDTWFFNKAHIRSITHRNTLDATTTSSAASYSASLDFKDKNGIAMGDIQCSKQPNNRNAIQVEATRTIGSTTYYNSIRWMISDTGGLSYSLSSPAAFRNVLGLGNTSGALPVANGGTGATARGGAHTSSGLLYKIGLQAGTGSAPSSGNAGMVYIQYS